jgi:hypothetical protein
VASRLHSLWDGGDAPVPVVPAARSWWLALKMPLRQRCTGVEKGCGGNAEPTSNGLGRRRGRLGYAGGHSGSGLLSRFFSPCIQSEDKDERRAVPHETHAPGRGVRGPGSGMLGSGAVERVARQGATGIKTVRMHRGGTESCSLAPPHSSVVSCEYLCWLVAQGYRYGLSHPRLRLSLPQGR